MKKSKRALIAKQTLQALEKGYYTNPSGKSISLKKQQHYAEVHTSLCRPDETSKLLNNLPLRETTFETVYEVKNETTLDTVRQLIANGAENIFCLNFASARNPGGGFLKGSDAQEESIARVSGLYPCQLKGKGYYDLNRSSRTCLYTDYMIYAPKVPIFKDEDGEPMEDVVTASILTAPAVNAGVVRRQEVHNIGKIEPTMKQRIAMVLAIALEKKHDTLVLGAWGCGVFDNKPTDIANWFKEALEGTFKGQFKRVVFAIKTKDEERYLVPFQETFL